LFNETYVEKVFNFSILRRVTQREGGRNLFTSAVSPISVVFYSKEIPKNPSEKIMYCAPKTAIKNRIINGIDIDKTDVKYLPRVECQKPDTKIWKIAMWGTERDYKLISNLFSKQKIYEIISEYEWKGGVGFQLSKPRNKQDFEIREIPFIEAKKINRFYTKKENSKQISDTSYRRLGHKKSYIAPHILIKEGQQNKKFCASYLDFDCSFRHNVYGIHSSDSNKLKLLTAYLNTNFVTYMLFLSSSNWGIERETVRPSEVFQLPDYCFSLPEKNQHKIINKINEIIRINKSNLLNSEQLISVNEQEIELFFSKAVNLSQIEKILIEDLLKFNLDAFQNKQKSIAYNPTQSSEIKLYAKFLSKTINDFLDYDEDLTVWTSIFDISARIPLNVVIVHFNKDKQADAVLKLPEKKIGQILKQMEQYSYQEYAESIYYRRFFRYSKEDKLYIIKPNEKRFWSRSMAINDADEIIAEVLNT